MSRLDVVLAVLAAVTAYGLTKKLGGRDRNDAAPFVAAAGALVLCGSTLPWATFGATDWGFDAAYPAVIYTESTSVTVGAGHNRLLNAVLGTAMLVLGVVSDRRAVPVGAVLGALAALVTVPDLLTLATVGDVTEVQVVWVDGSYLDERFLEDVAVRPGTGMLGALAGGILSVAVAVQSWRTREVPGIEDPSRVPVDE